MIGDSLCSLPTRRTAERRSRYNRAKVPRGSPTTAELQQSISFFSSVGCADDEALTRLSQTSFCFFGRFTSSGGDPAPSLGGRKKFSRTKISELAIFSGKSPFSCPKFLMTFF